MSNQPKMRTLPATVPDYDAAGHPAAVMPAEVTALFSVSLPGLASVLLRGRSALRDVLWMYLVVAVSWLSLILPLVVPGPPKDNDGLRICLFLACYTAVIGVSIRRGMRDRRRLIDHHVPPAAPRWLCLTLFGTLVVAALCGLVAVVGSIVLALSVGMFATILIPIGLVVLAAAMLLLAVVANALRSQWLYRAASAQEGRR